MLYERRKAFTGLDRRIGKAFSKIGLSPDQWTLLSILAGFVAAYFIYMRSFVAGAVLMGLSAFLDIVDGDVARARNVATNKGAYHDTIADRYVEFAIVLALVLTEMFNPIWLIVYLFGSTMTTYAKSAASEKGLVKELRGGLLERGERMTLLFAGILLASINTSYLEYIIMFLAIFSNVSALQRIWGALHV